MGPKTVALLYRELHVKSLEDLRQAADAGRIRSLKGMGPKKEQLILKALDEHQRHAGRHLLADTAAVADDVIAWLQERAPDVELIPVGSLRRGAETCGDLDILAIGGDAALMEAFTHHPHVERILGQGETKSSVILRGGFQADLRLVASHNKGAAMQYFTGSKPHNIALRDRALARGWRLNEYGLFDGAEQPIAGTTESGIYKALGLAFVEPELRENRGEITAAQDGALPDLIGFDDVRGDVHMHTTESDGRDDLATMIAAARARGLHYVAITDHTKSLAMANGLDEARAAEAAARIGRSPRP